MRGITMIEFHETALQRRARHFSEKHLSRHAPRNACLWVLAVIIGLQIGKVTNAFVIAATLAIGLISALIVIYCNSCEYRMLEHISLSGELFLDNKTNEASPPKVVYKYSRGEPLNDEDKAQFDALVGLYYE